MKKRIVVTILCAAMILQNVLGVSAAEIIPIDAASVDEVVVAEEVEESLFSLCIRTLLH